MTERFDSYFVSHGSPMLALDPGPAGAFWATLGKSLPRPEAVLCVSAHWYTAGPIVSSAAQPPTIHDFYGFPPPLYQQFYATPGAPELAARVRALLAAENIPCTLDEERGLDHGAWVPLRSLYPAGIPVVQLSVQPRLNALWHCLMGRALAPLREEGVLILGSGGAVHNLGEMAREGGPTPAWARDFDRWVTDVLASGREEEFLDWTQKAPSPRRAHPSPEHFLPIFVAYGAAGPGARGQLLYDDFTLGSLSMAAYRFAA
jgi:4,5-DOPA dioxygenase extradiol